MYEVEVESRTRVRETNIFCETAGNLIILLVMSVLKLSILGRQETLK